MKCLHVHVGVEDFAQSIRFHAALFAAEPELGEVYDRLKAADSAYCAPALPQSAQPSSCSTSCAG